MAATGHEERNLYDIRRLDNPFDDVMVLDPQTLQCLRCGLSKLMHEVLPNLGRDKNIGYCRAAIQAAKARGLLPPAMVQE